MPDEMLGGTKILIDHLCSTFAQVAKRTFTFEVIMIVICTFSNLCYIGLSTLVKNDIFE